MENYDEQYTCQACGCHEFYVEHYYTLTRYYVDTLPCECSYNDEDLAAMRNYSVSTVLREAGPLEEDHHWTYDESPEEIDRWEDEVEYEVYCPECAQSAERSDWETTEEDWEEDDHEFYVRCENCDREIEFGWSHPDRGGRIWPAEATDFNPWKSWPEPRYREAWLAKTWIRPDFR